MLFFLTCAVAAGAAFDDGDASPHGLAHGSIVWRLAQPHPRRALLWYHVT